MQAAAWWTTLWKLCCFYHLSWQDSSSSIWPEKHDMTLEDSQQENDNNNSFHPSLGNGSDLRRTKKFSSRALHRALQLTLNIHNVSQLLFLNAVSMKSGVEGFAVKLPTQTCKGRRTVALSLLRYSRARGLLCPDRHARAAPHASLPSRYFPVRLEPEGRKLSACFSYRWQLGFFFKAAGFPKCI